MAQTAAQKAAAAARAARAAAATTVTEPNSPQAPAVHATKGSGGVKETSRTVVVVCKMPRGMYLQLHQTLTQDQRVMGGGIEKRNVAMRIGEKVRLKPSVLPFGAIPNYPIENGFSLTKDVPADFWNKYVEQNPQFSMITEGLVRGFDNEADALAYCREYGKLKHGLEPLDVHGKDPDPRIEKTHNPNLSDLETDSDSRAA